LVKGDRIAYVGKNSDHYFELLFGAAKAGVVLAPIGWRLAPREIAYILGDAEARMVFVGPELLAHVRDVAELMLDQPIVIAMEANEYGHPVFEDWRDAAACERRTRRSPRPTSPSSSTPRAPRAGPRARC
jgi:long-chain acyl-CoA synthetase